MKKAISPVVTVVLILLVTVLAVLAFGNWNINFSSNLFIEQENADPRTVQAEISQLSGDFLFFANKGSGVTTVNTVTINNSDCGVISTDVQADEVEFFNISTCQPSSEGFFDAKVITNDNIYVRQFFFE